MIGVTDGAEGSVKPLGSSSDEDFGLHTRPICCYGSILISCFLPGALKWSAFPGTGQGGCSLAAPMPVPLGGGAAPSLLLRDFVDVCVLCWQRSCGFLKELCDLLKELIFGFSVLLIFPFSSTSFAFCFL